MMAQDRHVTLKVGAMARRSVSTQLHFLEDALSHDTCINDMIERN
jgi:hypothetical protein